MGVVWKWASRTATVFALVGGAGKAIKMLPHWKLAMPDGWTVMLVLGVIVLFAAAFSWCRYQWKSYQAFRRWVERSDPTWVFNAHEHPTLESKIVAAVAWRAAPLEERVNKLGNPPHATP